MIEQLLHADRLLSVDQVDQAEALYRRVSENDPLDAIAVVGLARCALARGDDRRAHELAARALAVDPENDMARRMEARLAEILAVRGEPVPRPASSALPPVREMRPVVAGDAPSGTAPSGTAPSGTAPSGASPVGTVSAGTSPGGTAPATAARAPTARPAPPRSLLDRLLGRA